MNFTRAIPLVFAALLAGTGLNLAAAPAAARPEKERSNATLQAGQRVARELLSQRPLENSSVRGTIKIRPKKGRSREISFKSEIIVGTNSWNSGYETEATPEVPATRLTIVHAESRAAQFLLETSDANGVFGAPRALTWKESLKPFAGSDFRIMDLAYPHSDHLAWPEQYILSRDIRRSKACYELESVNPNPANGGFAKVISWIIVDNGAPAYIHGYDQQGKEVLRFEPQGIRKIDGVYQATEFYIKNRKTGSRTTLKFDFDAATEAR
ncbi:MAG: hypothetical protein ACI9VS_002039 [Candidatus Binatia bacterium]|jgi:hypothetical protein